MSNHNYQEESFYTDYANRVDKFSRDLRYKKELNILSESLNIKKEDLLLDVGCGSGNAMEYFTEHYGCSVKGVEKIKEYIPLAKNPQDITVSDAQLLPFEDEIFDKVVIIHVVGHIEDPIKALKEARRVTKSGGRLGIITPNKYFIFLMKPLNWLGIIKHKSDPTRLRLYSINTIKSDFKKSGWNVIQSKTFGDLPKFINFFQGVKFFEIFKERIVVIAEKI